jgi:hypothetical protein
LAVHRPLHDTTSWYEPVQVVMVPSELQLSVMEEHAGKHPLSDAGTVDAVRSAQLAFKI